MPLAGGTLGTGTLGADGVSGGSQSTALLAYNARKGRRRVRYLRTNTATRIQVGPIIGVDGLTPQLTLTVTSERLQLTVDNNGTPTIALNALATASGGNNDMVHVSGDVVGMYDLELTASQLNYLGAGTLAIINGTAHAPWSDSFEIVPADRFDAMILGTDRLDVNVVTAVGRAWDSGGIAAATLATDARTAVQTATTAALTATMVDSVPAVGSIPSIMQAIYMLIQEATAKDINGPVVTIKKPNGAPLFGERLDDANVPTSITRTS